MTKPVKKNKTCEKKTKPVKKVTKPVKKVTKPVKKVTKVSDVSHLLFLAYVVCMSMYKLFIANFNILIMFYTHGA